MMLKSDALAHELAGFLRAAIDSARSDAGPGAQLKDASLQGRWLEEIERRLTAYEHALASAVVDR